MLNHILLLQVSILLRTRMLPLTYNMKSDKIKRLAKANLNK